MFENITKFFKKFGKKQNNTSNSKDTAKERLHLVLMQDRANVSADFLDLMRQEIIDVIKKYIEVDESAIDVRLTNKENEDGTNGAPALYANIPIISIKEEAKKEEVKLAKEKKQGQNGDASQNDMKDLNKKEENNTSSTEQNNPHEEAKKEEKADKSSEPEPKEDEKANEEPKENASKEANLNIELSKKEVSEKKEQQDS